jgi:hypothetical protein
MNFELAEEIIRLLKGGHLEQAIKFTEQKLKERPLSDFHKVLDRDLLHLTADLTNYLNEFYNSATIFFAGEKTGLLNSLFKKKASISNSPKAIYCEMNGFTINYDRWYIDLFAYKKFKGLEDISWLSDFEYDSENSLTITGFEDLQKVYEDYMENEKWNDEELRKSCDICEFLIILRLQQLFRKSFLDNKDKKHEWTEIPVLVTAHEYDIIYNSTQK